MLCQVLVLCLRSRSPFYLHSSVHCRCCVFLLPKRLPSCLLFCFLVSSYFFFRILEFWLRSQHEPFRKRTLWHHRGSIFSHPPIFWPTIVKGLRWWHWYFWYFDICLIPVLYICLWLIKNWCPTNMHLNTTISPPAFVPMVFSCLLDGHLFAWFWPYVVATCTVKCLLAQNTTYLFWWSDNVFACFCNSRVCAQNAEQNMGFVVAVGPAWVLSGFTRVIA